MKTTQLLCGFKHYIVLLPYKNGGSPIYVIVFSANHQSMGIPDKAIFGGDIPLHRPYIGLIYGRYLQFRILEWPLNQPLSNSAMEALRKEVREYLSLRLGDFFGAEMMELSTGFLGIRTVMAQLTVINGITTPITKVIHHYYPIYSS